jgi:very-short-patch-repair endonuclease
MPKQSASPDERIARIAAHQHGVIIFAQLIGAGLIPSTIDARVRSGRLHRIHRSVYAVGHPGLGNEGRWMAAVLACGDGAALSHLSAAEHLGLLEVVRGPAHVTIGRDVGRKSRTGVVVHRSSSLTKGDVVIRNGIATTNAARTLRDLRRSLSPGLVAKAERVAGYKGWLGNEEEGAGGRGLGSRADVSPRLARSRFERRFLRFCARRHLPRPEVNAKLGPYTVDFLWRQATLEGPSASLVVETDGWQGHRGRQAFEDDRARDLYLRNRGYEVVRFSWRQLGSDPDAIAFLLRRYLC